jgi:uncharacterized protein (DUF433 family)
MPRSGATTRASRKAKAVRRQGLLTRREAAEITGSSISTINKAIEQRVLPVHREGRQPLLDTDGVALITIFARSPVRLPVSVKKDVRKWIVSEKPYRGKKLSELAVAGGVVVIRCTNEVRDRAEAGERYARDRDRFIVSDPDIFGGAPVISGTRLLASAIARRIDAGDSFEMLEQERPDVPPEAFEAAYRYAKANPQRGRPAKPWRKQTAA